MDKSFRKLPIGVQSFEKLRQEDFLYIDKTAYIYDLIKHGAPYFLSRPRRFGKSLLISTLKAYFEGKRELFKGLLIEKLTEGDPEAFTEYPVFHFDFNKADYSKGISDSFKDSGDREEEILPIEKVLDAHLSEWEKIYGADSSSSTLALRFDHLLKEAGRKTGKRAVILVDEYDKPLLESDESFLDANRRVFKGFFSVLKSDDEYIKFVFITGVTKFSKVSIFSDINQLQDISLNEAYSGICGITEKEMITAFMPEINALGERRKLSEKECLDKLKKMYDGYHFAEVSEGVYNPFSILNAFSERKFGSYWFESGTPSFLIEMLKQTGFDPKKITEHSIYSNERELSDYRTDNPDPVPLLYQSGYLTISGYDDETEEYLLDYPNDEVRYGFLECISPVFLNAENEISPLDIRSFRNDIKAGDTGSLRERFTALFARIPYPADGDGKYVERDFQNVIYITFMLLGQYIHTELHSSKGRADAVVETKDIVYIFEFKCGKSAEEALQQIEDKGYAVPYAADSRRILKIGVNFDPEKRNLEGWKSVEG